MTNNLKFAYNLGIAENFNKPITDRESYQRRIDTNKALICSLCIYERQVGYAKSFVNNHDRSAGTENMPLNVYKDVLISLAFSLLQRNVQATTNKLNKLSGYGWHLNNIRNVVYADQNTANGYVGTLGYFQPQDNQNSSGLDYLEQTLVNYYNSINIDPYATPRAKYLKVLDQVGLSSREDYYLDLETAILEYINNQNDVRQKLNFLLLNQADFKKLQPKILLLELDDDTITFFDYLNSDNRIDINMTDTRNTLINFAPVGGLPLFLLALCTEGMLVLSRYITLLSEEQQNSTISSFVNSNPVEAQQMAEYLALTYDATNYLKYSLEEFNVFNLGLLNDLKLFLVNDVKSEGDYRLDG